MTEIRDLLNWSVFHFFVVVLGLGRNELGGTVPSELGMLDGLIALGLERNRLTGKIISEVGNMKSLGKFPLWYCDWTRRHSGGLAEKKIN
jgi:hypothetical protein